MDRDEALLALAAYIRVRREVAPGAAVEEIPDLLGQAPALNDLIETIGGFIGSDPERGARGMALVAAAYRTAGFGAVLPSRNDPRRIDISITRSGRTLIGVEVKQVDTTEATADTLAADATEIHVHRALLAVLPPGSLVDFDRTATVRRAEHRHGIVLRVAAGVREVVHERRRWSIRSAGSYWIRTFVSFLHLGVKIRRRKFQEQLRRPGCRPPWRTGCCAGRSENISERQ